MDNNFEIKDNKIFFNKDNFNNCEVIAMINDNVLVKCSGHCEEYIIGAGFNFKTKSWNWGHYFTKQGKALDYFTKNYIRPILEMERKKKSRELEH